MSALTDFARALAIYLHDGQVDKQGEPYRKHLATVAVMVEMPGVSEEVIAAAWLHDVLEDRKISMGVLRALIPAHTYKIVLALVRREVETYSSYIDRLCNPKFPSDPRAYRDARLIKLADLKSNLDPTRPINESLRLRYEKARQTLLVSQMRYTLPIQEETGK